MPLQAKLFTPFGALADYQKEWTDLWERAGHPPLASWEGVLAWEEYFGKDQPVYTVVISSEESGQFIAAIPLQIFKKYGLLSIGRLLENPWFPAGGILFDPSYETKIVAPLVCEALAKLPVSVCQFQNFQELTPSPLLLEMAKMNRLWNPKVEFGDPIALFDLPENQEGFEKRLSRNFRRSITKAKNRLKKVDKVKFEIRSDFSSGDELFELIQQCFEVEKNSWKGKEESSVIQNGLLPLYQAQGESLWQSENFFLARLWLDEHLVAFNYGWKWNETYYSLKIGYDEEFSWFSPGKILFYFCFCEFIEKGEGKFLHPLSPETPFLKLWKPQQHPNPKYLFYRKNFTGSVISMAHAGVSALKKWTSRRSET